MKQLCDTAPDPIPRDNALIGGVYVRIVSSRTNSVNVTGGASCSISNSGWLGTEGFSGRKG